MAIKRIGTQTVRFSDPPRIESFANIGGKEEGRGPLAPCFDELGEDSYFGEATWEKGESRMQKRVLYRALEVDPDRRTALCAPLYAIAPWAP